MSCSSGNLFCIVAKTGSGKNMYLNRLLLDKSFLDLYNLSLLVYGTTRRIREGEKEGIDYYFHTKEQFENINVKDLIEIRDYNTINDGIVHYFTKTEYLDISKNIICIASPFQVDAYKEWINNEGNNINLYIINIEMDLDIRMKRTIERANGDEKTIYELCRRVVAEKNEFDKMILKNKKVLTENIMSNNILFINNNSCYNTDIEDNLNKIKKFISDKVTQ